MLPSSTLFRADPLPFVSYEENEVLWIRSLFFHHFVFPNLRFILHLCKYQDNVCCHYFFHKSGHFISPAIFIFYPCWYWSVEKSFIKFLNSKNSFHCSTFSTKKIKHRNPWGSILFPSLFKNSCFLKRLRDTWHNYTRQNDNLLNDTQHRHKS